MIPEPRAAEVESVVYLVGDAGDAIEGRSPLLLRLRADVEDWSGRLRGDTAVVVLFLGDNVYPDGMDRPDEPAYQRDSTVLQGQVNAVSGRFARQHAWAFFMAGNHDWGDYRSGDARIKVQESFLDRARSRGTRVRLLPKAGDPGPIAVDVGSQLRILIFDTAWWLLASDKTRKVQAFQNTEKLLQGAGNRQVMIAAHHPFKSAASHGGNVAFWRSLGVQYVLARSGALLQDLNSIPYRGLLDAMQAAFRKKQPLVFAGGHDHALQVIREYSAGEPKFSLVSGAASKVGRIGQTQGMLYRASTTGYMKLFFRRDGHAELFVVAAPGRSYLSCAGDGEALERCMAESTAGFQTRFGMRLN